VKTVTKEITFDAAHMLSGYDGLCGNLHGHTYRLQLTVGSERLNESGMVVDFGELKAFLKEQAADKFDHAIIFAGEGSRGESEEALLHWAKKFGQRHFVLPRGFPTAESMAQYVFDTANRRFAVVSVKLWETPDSFAEVTKCG
jgi:6-pyruvoyltetrahydropterin/6-carboxytetrahydropterin synthase